MPSDSLKYIDSVTSISLGESTAFLFYNHLFDNQLQVSGIKPLTWRSD